MGVSVGCGLVMTSRGGLRVVEEKSQAALLDVKPWSNLVKLSTSRAMVINNMVCVLRLTCVYLSNMFVAV
jgi:hypothetical protein